MFAGIGMNDERICNDSLLPIDISKSCDVAVYHKTFKKIL
jgi:hypothetical protein